MRALEHDWAAANDDCTCCDVHVVEQQRVLHERVVEHDCVAQRRAVAAGREPHAAFELVCERVRECTEHDAALERAAPNARSVHDRRGLEHLSPVLRWWCER